MVSKKISIEVIKKSLFPFLLLLGVIFAAILYSSSIREYLSPNLKNLIDKFIKVLSVVNIAFIFQRMVGGFFLWYQHNIVSVTKTHLDDEFLPLFRRSSKILIWIIAFLIILPIFGINISALIATLGVSSLAIALAAQDTIANIIAGFMIMIDRPFRVKDKIKLPSGETVEVLDIGIRRSRFLSSDGAIIIYPNLELSKSKIINYTYGKEKLGNKINSSST